MRIIRFGSWLVVGVLLIVVISITGKLVVASPAVLEGGIAYAEMGVPPAETLTLPGRAFTCILGDKLDQCTATVEEQTLEISMHYPSGERVGFASDVTCQATYDNNLFECEAVYDYSPGRLPTAQFSSTLGLSATQVAFIRRTYPLDQGGETGWFRLIRKVTIVSAILSCLVVWLNSGHKINEVIGLSAGVITTSLSYGIFMVLLAVFAGSLKRFDGLLPFVSVVGIGAGIAVLSGVLIALKTYERANQKIASSGMSLVLLGLTVASGFGLFVNITPVISVILVVLILAIGAIKAIFEWWQPLLIGRAIASINVGLFVYFSLFCSFFLLLNGLGLVD